MLSLTPKQAKVLKWITARIQKTGACPSYTEIGIRFHMKSLNSVAQVLQQLEDRGAIRKGGKNAKRSIQILEHK